MWGSFRCEISVQEDVSSRSWQVLAPGWEGLTAGEAGRPLGENRAGGVKWEVAVPSPAQDASWPSWELASSIQSCALGSAKRYPKCPGAKGQTDEAEGSNQRWRKMCLALLCR